MLGFPAVSLGGRRQPWNLGPACRAHPLLCRPAHDRSADEARRPRSTDATRYRVVYRPPDISAFSSTSRANPSRPSAALTAIAALWSGKRRHLHGSRQRWITACAILSSRLRLVATLGGQRVITKSEMIPLMLNACP